MRKRIFASLVMVVMMLFSTVAYAAENPNPNTPYAEMNERESLTADLWTEMISCMNSMSDGDKIIFDGIWVLECDENSSVSMARSVYSDTKTESKTWTVKRLGTDTAAYKITQNVTFVVNDAEGTVTITKYSTSCNVFLSDFTCIQKTADTINNELSTSFATGFARYAIDSVLYGVSVWICPNVTVTRTGMATFAFDLV